jgi:hypothetical protein
MPSAESPKNVLLKAASLIVFEIVKLKLFSTIESGLLFLAIVQQGSNQFRKAICYLKALNVL